MTTSTRPRLRVIVTDELGLVRVAEAPSSSEVASLETVARWGEPDKDRRAITASALHVVGGDWVDEGASLLALGRADGTIDVVDPLTGAVAATVAPSAKTAAPPPPSPPPPRGVAFLPHSAGTGCTRLPLLLAADAGGEVRLLAPSRGDGDGGADANGGSDDAPPPLTYTLAGRLAGPPRPVAMDVHAPTARAAFAVDGGEAALWDVAARSAIFRAKGDKPDKLGMVDAAGGASIAFLPAADPGGRVFVAGTARGKVRLYDARHGARPAATVVPSAAGAGGAAAHGARRAVTALSPGAGGGANPLAVWAGDAGGLLRCVDLAARRAEGVLKGATGAVAAVAVWPPPDAAAAAPRLVASAGVDGFVRVHDAAARRQLAAVYMKQPLAGVHWCPAAPGSGTVVEGGSGVEAEAGGAGKRKKRDARAKKDKKKRR